MTLISTADIIGFDCDSTLSTLEGIDELAIRADVGEQMIALTNQAMDGIVPLEAVYKQRLELIRPNKQAIDWLAQRYIETIVDGVAEVFKQLLAQGKTVHIISGGIREAIVPLAQQLGIPDNQLHAVSVLFNKDGSYQGFDENSPLARSGGKADICRKISNQQAFIMIGDGKTDLESQQAGACFVGFGGVVAREAVLEQADYCIREASLLGLLTL